ncbi:MAG: hypothetical protein ACYS8X_07180 [Planctomycetota bacterium]|jgi:regulator of replication initiation timing
MLNRFLIITLVAATAMTAGCEFRNPFAKESQPEAEPTAEPLVSGEVAELEERIEMLRQTVTELEQANDEFAVENERLQVEVKELTWSHAQQEDMLRDYGKAVEDRNTQTMRAEQLMLEKARLESQVASLEASLAGMDNQLQELRDQIRALRKIQPDTLPEPPEDIPADTGADDGETPADDDAGDSDGPADDDDDEDDEPFELPRYDAEPMD